MLKEGSQGKKKKGWQQAALRETLLKKLFVDFFFLLFLELNFRYSSDTQVKK